MPSLVAYYRVSTAKQGNSGLGLEAQKSAVEAHAKATGSTLLASYREIESGKHSDRPELAKALLHAKRARATLVVAKLDRLARNVAFLSALMESGVEFVACDQPHANRLTIHILAAVAEDEARRISERTKAALQAAKARGLLLGSARIGAWEGIEHLRLAGAAKGRKVARKVRQENARKAHAELCPEMLAMRDDGLTLQQIADRLNAEQKWTRQGKEWNAVYVHRYLAK